VIQRGEIWWADLGDPGGAGPGYRRPVLVVQADAFNRSRIATVIAVVLTSNLRLVEAPGNVLLAARESGLPRDSVANVSQVVTLDRAELVERAGRLSPRLMARVDGGLRLVLGLGGAA
jgi:mRNA interferase MazF